MTNQHLPDTTDGARSTTSEPGDAPVALTRERDDFCFGVIAARVNETRFAKGGRRYGVVFRRNVSGLCLEGEFSMSLGQDELMDLIAAASAAYFAIEQIRFRRKCSECPDRPFDRLPRVEGWEPDHEEVFSSQIEP